MMACNDIITHIDSPTLLQSNATDAVIALQSNAVLQHTISTAQVGVLLSDTKNSDVTMSWHRLIVVPLEPCHRQDIIVVEQQRTMALLFPLITYSMAYQVHTWYFFL